jgi:hypothetical protein
MKNAIKLALTIDKNEPSDYAFHHSIKSRSFRTEYARNENETSIVLFDRLKTDYELCHFRGIITSIDRLAKLINDWLENQLSVEQIALKYNELEKFEDFGFKHPNPKIEAKWIKVKNMQFNELSFWKHQDWHNRYDIMLIEAKKRKEFAKLYPFTSLYWLRFSMNDKLTKTWQLGLHIVPTWDTSEGLYFVDYPINEGDSSINPIGRSFVDINEALDFYAAKLNEFKPIK